MASATLRQAAVRAATLVTTALFAACGGSTSETVVQQTPPTPAISIVLSVSALDVQAGATGSITVTLTRSGGFAGDVTIAVNGLPAGVTTSTATIGAGQTSASVTLSAGASATPGTTSVVIQASGSGIASVTASLALTIRAQTATPSFAMGISPTSLSVAAGASGTATITITRSSTFTGPVTLTVAGSVVGMTPTFSPATVTGGTATLTVALAATAAPGSVTVTIRGSGTGVADQTVALPVTITAASSGNITWRSCGPTLAAWLAVQDGAGAWTRVVGVNDTYSFSLSSGRGGVAYVVVSPGVAVTTLVVYGTASELQAMSDAQCGGFAGPGKTVTAAIAGANPTDLVQTTLGRSHTSVFLSQSSTATFSGVGNAPVDLVASNLAQLTVNPTSYAIKKVIIRRGLTPAAGSALAPIDFGGAEAFDPVMHTVTIANLGSDSAGVISYYATSTNVTPTGAFTAPLTAGTAASTGGTLTYAGIPGAKQVAGDLHILVVQSHQSGATESQRLVTSVFKNAVDQTVALGPVLAAPTVTAIAGTGRVQAVITPPAEYNSSFGLLLEQSTGLGGPLVVYGISQTRAYASGSTVTLTIPDLTAVSAFDLNWGLKVGGVAAWIVTASGGPLQAVFDGLTYGSGYRLGTITP